MSTLPKTVKIFEVGPRDGLQNEPRHLTADIKCALIEKLADCGLKHIEAGSFVNPKWVPQMAGSEEIFAQIKRKNDVHYTALTPNIKGYERAVESQVDEIAIFTAASEAFTQKNINCSIDESLQRFEPVMQAAAEANIPVRAYVSCAAGCPYEGKVDKEKVAELSETLVAMGCYEIAISDTTGVGTPGQYQQLIEATSKRVDMSKLAVHCHDTYGQALANIFASLQCGIRVVDSSIAGLGGCPYAKGASGNVATEDVVYMLNGLGIETGLDLDALVRLGNEFSALLGRPNQSRVASALT